MDTCPTCGMKYNDGLCLHRDPRTGQTETACYTCLYAKYPEQYPLPNASAA